MTKIQNFKPNYDNGKRTTQRFGHSLLEFGFFVFWCLEFEIFDAFKALTQKGYDMVL
jgi:hypothetical protein